MTESKAEMDEKQESIPVPPINKRLDVHTPDWVRQEIKMKEAIDPEGFKEVPTNSFGEIDFKGATRRSKAKFVRFSDSTSPDLIFLLLTKRWQLENPRLLISVIGGTESFDMDPKLKQTFQTGLLKVAQTPGAWVITGGTNTGAMQLVGEALQGTINACIGISTYGIVTNRHLLSCSEDHQDTGGKFSYHVPCSLVDKGAYLDHNHTHHLLVDDGSDGEFGREIHFRSQLEKHIMERKVPTVLLVLHGGIGTIKTVWEAVSDDCNISVVVVKETGKAAYLLADALSLVLGRDVKQWYIDSDACFFMVRAMIDETFPGLDGDDKSTCIDQLLFCLSNRECFTVFEMDGKTKIDEDILVALLNVQRDSPVEQLRLTISWDRADLAKEKVLSQAYEWELHALKSALIMSLAMDRVDFVKLLLEYGVSIEQLLTNDILEFLYGYQSQTSTSTLNQEIDVKEYSSSNMDTYGDVFATLCSCEGFNPRKCAIPLRIIRQVIRVLCKRLMNKENEEFVEGDNSHDSFTYPYRELFFWAVLNNKQKMAIYLWGFEEGAMSKALIAAEINNTLYEHAQKYNLQDDLVKSFANNAREFKDLALMSLDKCYKADESKTVKLITCQSDQFPNTTSLDLAVNIKDREYVSHESVQFLLNEVWTGCIQQRNVTDLELFCAYLFPPLLSQLEFVSEAAIESKSCIDDDSKNDDVRECLISDKTQQSDMYGTLGNTDEVTSELSDSKDGGCERVSYKGKKRIQKTAMPFCHKFYLFYFETPVAKFFSHVLSYFIFLYLFAYVMMLKKGKQLVIPEYLLIVYMVALTVAKLYEITQNDCHPVRCKIKSWLNSPWNKLDCGGILFYFAALAFRLHEETIDVSHVMLAIDGAFWVVRLLHLFCVHRILGPYVVMIYRMTQDILYFLVILLVFMISYGCASRAILEPQPTESIFFTMKDILFHPYFNIYGELFINNQSSNVKTVFGTPVNNSYSETVAWILLALYLLITNVLLLNILIAIFNNKLNDVQQHATLIWKYERHALVIGYAKRAVLASPLNLLVHLFLLIKWICQKCGMCHQKDGSYSCGLKPDVTEKERGELIEFESNCLAPSIGKQEKTLPRYLEEMSADTVGRLDTIQETVTSCETRLKDLETNLAHVFS